MREAALWFGVGGAVAAFVTGAVLVLAAAVSADATHRLARVVGERVDKLVGLEPPRATVVVHHLRRDGRC